MTGIFKSAVTTAFVVALSTVAAAGYAADKDKASKSPDWPSFRKVDADKSGSISMDEARSIPGLADTFTQYDKNNDGQLSRSEYESAKKTAKTGSSTSHSSATTMDSKTGAQNTAPSSVGGGSTPGGPGAGDGAGAGGSSAGSAGGGSPAGAGAGSR